MVYFQWVIILLNLPTQWLPWTTASSDSTAAEGSGMSDALQTLNNVQVAADAAFGVLLGRRAPLDCWLQAWGYLQDGTHDVLAQKVFARAVGR